MNRADINSWLHFLLEGSKLWNLFVPQFPYLKHRLRSACLVGLVCELNETMLVRHTANSLLLGTLEPLGKSCLKSLEAREHVLSFNFPWHLTYSPKYK